MKAGMSELRSSRRVRANGGVRPAREYDPFVRGRFPVGVRTIQALDKVRNRLFPCEIWYPAAAQHAGYQISQGNRRFRTLSSAWIVRTPTGNRPRTNGSYSRAGLTPPFARTRRDDRSSDMPAFIPTYVSNHSVG